MQESPPAGAIYLKADALDRLTALLDDALGKEASQEARARYLDLNYATYWRYFSTRGRKKRHRPPNDTMAKFLRRFPHLTFYDLFETDDKVKAAA